MRNIRLGSLLGIPILVNPSWFILFGLATWMLATQYYPDVLPKEESTTHYVMAATSALVFFISILLHELAHSAVAKAYRIPVRSITLFIFGGVSQITRDATKPLNELFMAIAGPLTSLVLGALFIAAWWAIGADATRPVDHVLIWLGGINLAIGVFNMIPAFPMDGGRVFRSLIWLFGHNYNRATVIAAWTGRGAAWLMLAVGFLGVLGYATPITGTPAGGAWMLLIGLFLENAARQSLLQNRLVQTLQQYSAGDLMVPDPPVVEGQMSVASLARGVLELNPRVCYFVEDHGKLGGLISAYQMRAIPEALWDTTTAAQAMVPSAKLRATGRNSLASEVLLEMENEDLLHMPVVEEGRVIGVIGRDRILGVLRQAGLIRAPQG
jgi:Zn-dependent protease